MNYEAIEGSRPIDPLGDFFNRTPNLPGAENRFPWRQLAMTGLTLLGVGGGSSVASARTPAEAPVEDTQRHPPVVRMVESGYLYRYPGDGTVETTVVGKPKQLEQGQGGVYEYGPEFREGLPKRLKYASDQEITEYLFGISH